MAFNIYADPNANPVQSYDLHTPFGIRPGQVTPAEELRQEQIRSQSGIAAQMMAQNNAADMRDQQMRALRESLGGGGGGGEMAAPGAGMGGGESYADRQNRMAQDRMFGMANARDLTRINSGVPELGSDMDMMDRNAMRSLGETTTHNELLRQQQEEAMLEELSKLGGAAGGVPGATQIPNAPTSGGDLKFMTPEGANILVGNSGGGAPAGPAAAGAGAPAMGGMSQRIRDLATLSAIRNNQPIPDFAGQDLDRQMKMWGFQRAQQQAGYADQLQRMQASQDIVDRVRQQAEAARARGDITGANQMATQGGVALSQIPAQKVFTDSPAIQEKLKEAIQTMNDASKYGRDVPALLDRPISEIRQMMIQKGADPADADAFIKQQLDQLLREPNFWTQVGDVLSPGIPFGQESTAGQIRQRFGLQTYR